PIALPAGDRSHEHIQAAKNRAAEAALRSLTGQRPALCARSGKRALYAPDARALSRHLRRPSEAVRHVSDALRRLEVLRVVLRLRVALLRVPLRERDRVELDDGF